MLEVKVTIEAPALAEAINNLAGAIGNREAAPAAVIPMNAPVNAPEATQQAETAAPVETPTVQQNEAPAAPQSVPAPVPETPAQTAPEIDLEAISRAGAALIDQGKMPRVMALLQKYGVQAITQLQASTYPAFAEDLRGLGAAI